MHADLAFVRNGYQGFRQDFGIRPGRKGSFSRKRMPSGGATAGWLSQDLECGPLGKEREERSLEKYG
jgi:hypothetical protein